jgi:predicted RNA-binding Zn ribbon-like protein
MSKHVTLIIVPADLGTANAARRAAALTGALLRDPPSRDEVEAILLRYGEPEPPGLTDDDLAALGEAAARLLPVFEASTTDEAARRLNALLSDHAGPPRLTAHDATPWHLHVDEADDAPWAGWFLASSSLALATVLADRQAPPGGICAAHDCAQPFVDLGRGPARRFCSERCATRTRVAELRRRRR